MLALVLAYLAIGLTNAVGLLLNHLVEWKDEVQAFDVLVAYPLAVLWCVLVWPYALYHDYNLCSGADNE